MRTKVAHRFIRSANIDSNIHNRVANRFNPIANTQTTLTDPASGRTLTLIGTTNSSTTLAQRTKNLLEQARPDAVYVQASPVWWNYAEHIDVPTQKLFSLASKDFPEASYKFQNHLRGLLFRARYFLQSLGQYSSPVPLSQTFVFDKSINHVYLLSQAAPFAIVFTYSSS